MIRLGVNIDHVATLRQQRMTTYPDPVRAAVLAEEAGADLITLHLREDRRHIQDKDVFNVRDAIATRMNLECAITAEMLDIAKQVRPHDVCLVPEKRHELTTEGGLNVVDHFDVVQAAVQGLKEQGIRVSLFIDPDEAQIDAAYRTQADAIEIHTGEYAEQFEASSTKGVEDALNRVKKAISLGLAVGLQVNAGHGLHYTNVRSIAELAGITELNIGHAIVAYAVFEGWHKAVSDMKALLVQYAPRVTL